MADLKLSQLTALVGTASGDEVYIRDVSVAVVNQSKSITITELLKTFFADMTADVATGPVIRNVASSGSVATLIPNQGTVAGIGGSGGAVDIITGSGLSGLRVGTGPGQVNTIVQAGGTSGLLAGSVSGSFALHNLASSATVPTLLPNFLDETSGWGGVSGTISAIIANVEQFTFSTGALTAGITGGPAIRNELASNTNPVFNPNKANAGTGLGTDSSGNFSAMIHNGAEAFRFNTSGNLSLANVNTVLGASLLNEVPSLINPSLVPDGADLATGIGVAASALSLITASISRMVLSAANMTKGNIYVANGTTLIPVAVGANDEVLTADSVEATGVKWAVPGVPNEVIELIEIAGGQVLGVGTNKVTFDTTRLNSDTGTFAVAIDEIEVLVAGTYRIDIGLAGDYSGISVLHQLIIQVDLGAGFVELAGSAAELNNNTGTTTGSMHRSATVTFDANDKIRAVLLRLSASGNWTMDVNAGVFSVTRLL